MDINELLIYCFNHGVSDLHLVDGDPPFIRIDGSLRRKENTPKFEEDEVQTLIYSILRDDQIREFETTRELDFSYGGAEVCRFRVNLSRTERGPKAVFRQIPNEPPTIETLNTSDADLFRQFATRRQGLILVTGTTGSGKSTTLAAIIDEINRTRPTHIITLEDPIEFVHENKLSQVDQRELGKHTYQLPEGLIRALRQDPDVILVGEMRDLVTTKLAVEAAETGHLVLSTVHTNSAAQTIERIVNICPAEEQSLVRIMLANSLEAIISQQLVEHKSGKGRVLATEILINNTAIAPNIKKPGGTAAINTAIQTGQCLGMHTMDQCLAELYRRELISYNTALERANSFDDMKTLLSRQ